MGQKVNPIGLRLKIINNWSSIWYAPFSDYAKKLHQDLKMRKYIMSNFKSAMISDVIFSHKIGLVSVNVQCARVGSIVGKGGIEKIKAYVGGIVGCDIIVNIVEIKKPDIDARLVAASIAQQLEKGGAFKKAMKRAMQACFRSGAIGAKMCCSGRLAGAEIARTEWCKEGRVPLHTLRANIGYGVAEAKMSYGIIGVKVWIYINDVAS